VRPGGLDEARDVATTDEIIEAGALAEDVGEFQRNFDEAWREVVSA
jgi:hypothetical protein